MSPPETTADCCHDVNDGTPLFYEFDFMKGARLRTDDEYTEIYDHVTRFRDTDFTTKTYGINDFNVLHRFVDSPRSFPVDEMHNLYINNGVNHFDLLRGVTFERYDIAPNAGDSGSAPGPSTKKTPDSSRKRTRSERLNDSDLEESDLDLADVENSDSDTTDGDTNMTRTRSRKVRKTSNRKTASTRPSANKDPSADKGKKKKAKTGKKRKDKKLPKFLDGGEEFGITVKSWWAIGHDMDLTRQLGGIPTCFGYNIRSITRFCHNFKAEEWKTWYLRYMPIYFRDRMTAKHYLANMDFHRILKLCTMHSLPEQELEELEKCLERFINYYNKEIYQLKFERVVIWKSSLHHLGHIVWCIRNCGPMYGFACWVIERINGIIARGTRSRKDTNRNISINALQREQFNHLKYTFSEDSFKRDKDGDGGAVDDDADGILSNIPDLHFGFDTANERACVFSSFRLYLDTLQEGKDLAELNAEEKESETESHNEAISSDIERRNAYDSHVRKQARLKFRSGFEQRKRSRIQSRDKRMMRSRGRALAMSRELKQVTDNGKMAFVPGSGKASPITPDIKRALIKDAKGCWTNCKDWGSLRIRSYGSCRIMSHGSYSASEFTVSSMSMRKRGVNRCSSLCQVRDIDAAVPEQHSSDEEENEEEPPLAVAEVHLFFTVEIKAKRKKRGFVNPNLIQETPEEIDSDTVFALVKYYDVVPDKAFLSIPKNPKPTSGVVNATDIDGLIGFVMDRKKKMLVDKYGPIYANGEFDPSLYEVDDPNRQTDAEEGEDDGDGDVEE